MAKIRNVKEKLGRQSQFEHSSVKLTIWIPADKEQHVRELIDRTLDHYRLPKFKKYGKNVATQTDLF